MIQLAGNGTQTGFYITQALAMSQLGERHAEPLIPAREAAQMPVRLMACDTRLELALRNEVHQLREDHPTLIHPLRSSQFKSFCAVCSANDWKLGSCPDREKFNRTAVRLSHLLQHFVQLRA